MGLESDIYFLLFKSQTQYFSHGKYIFQNSYKVRLYDCMMLQNQVFFTVDSKNICYKIYVKHSI